MTLSATSWQWRCNHAVINRAKWNLQQLSDLTVADRPDLLNNRPRKILGFKTPQEVFSTPPPGAFHC